MSRVFEKNKCWLIIFAFLFVGCCSEEVPATKDLEVIQRIDIFSEGKLLLETNKGVYIITANCTPFLIGGVLNVTRYEKTIKLEYNSCEISLYRQIISKPMLLR